VRECGIMTMISKTYVAFHGVIEENQKNEVTRICGRYVLDVVSRLLGCRSLVGCGLKEKEVKEYLYKLG
jgi:hypothetical protein